MSDNKMRSDRGFSLLGALLLMFLVSALSVALMYSVGTERQISSADQEQNLSRYAAEAAMEKMTADVGSLYTSVMSPQLSDISALGATINQPSLSGVTYSTYSVFADPDTSTPPKPNAVTKTITSGQNAGLYAQTIPIHMDVIATRNSSSAQVHIKRDAEVALIPVFQFGVFSDSDLSFFPGPAFDFNGRVFTNGNLFLAAQDGPLSFHSKMSTAGDVVRTVLVNNSDATPRTNLVLVPTATGGCDGGTQPPTAVSSTCKNLDQTMGSLSSGNPYSGTPTESSTWPTISNTTFGGQIQTQWNGIHKLNLPFVGSSGLAPWEIIKRPPQTGSDPAATSREYSMAQIRILLGDNNVDFPGGTQPGDVWLGNTAPVAITVTGAGAGIPNPAYLAWAKNLPYSSSCSSSSCIGPNDVNPGWFQSGASNTWPLIGGYLRVEYRDAGGNYNNVTQEWLNFGFARGQATPNNDASVCGSCTTAKNTVHPNAILIFQKQPSPAPPGYTWMGAYSSSTTYSQNQLVVYNGVLYNYIKSTSASNKTPTGANLGTYWSATAFPWANLTKTAGDAQFGWFPINMYDPREGEFAHGTTRNANSCAVGGLMNVVEIDMDNLRKWLNGIPPFNAGGLHGTSVENVSQNGYIVYFSDRRGMQKPPGATYLDGEYGYEPVVDALHNTWSPHGFESSDGSEIPVSSAQTAMGGSAAGEDINGTTFSVNGGGDGWIASHGRFGLGNGFGAANLVWPTGYSGTSLTDSPAARIAACGQVGQSNQVTGARHALKLVDGSKGHLPMDGNGNPQGITIASEQPVYVEGNYNADSTTGNNWNASGYTHSAAAVIADAVTLLSNSFDDRNTFFYDPNSIPAVRNASDTYFRVAIASGKNRPFFQPGFGAGDWGTDGGVHNFIRYLENWGGVTSHYRGSLVSMFYARYGNGIYGNPQVYSPPTRDYSFDTDFLNPTKLPPGTPRLQDINNLSFHQDLSPRAY